jgi:hypothetical protein
MTEPNYREVVRFPSSNPTLAAEEGPDCRVARPSGNTLLLSSVLVDLVAANKLATAPCSLCVRLLGGNLCHYFWDKKRANHAPNSGFRRCCFFHYPRFCTLSISMSQCKSIFGLLEWIVSVGVSLTALWPCERR